jgi:hypothetical protein
MAPAVAHQSPLASHGGDSDPAAGYTIIEPARRSMTVGSGIPEAPSHTDSPAASTHKRASSNGHNDAPLAKSGSLKPTRPRPAMARSRSDFVGGRRADQHERQQQEQEHEQHLVNGGEFQIRHGFESQLLSEEYNDILNSVSTSSPWGWQHRGARSGLTLQLELLDVLYRAAS